VIRNPHKPEFQAKIMKAAVVPAVNSAWEIKEIETPEPGPGQLLIKIRASGMCYTDVHQTRGELPVKFPRTLGHEPVGEIESVETFPLEEVARAYERVEHGQVRYRAVITT
jgi:D-arabinose 1-dehydrogenase-like Zn-dependent alcohol dehydrogenase